MIIIIIIIKILIIIIMIIIINLISSDLEGCAVTPINCAANYLLPGASADSRTAGCRCNAVDTPGVISARNHCKTSEEVISP